MQVVVVLQVEPERRRCSERLAQPRRAVGANSDTLLHDALDARARDTQPLGERACGQIERLQKLLAQDLAGIARASWSSSALRSTNDTISKELSSQSVIRHAGGGPVSNGRKSVELELFALWRWWPDGDGQTATLAQMDDRLPGFGRLHCDVTDRANLWRFWRRWGLLHALSRYYPSNIALIWIKRNSEDDRRTTVPLALIYLSDTRLNR